MTTQTCSDLWFTFLAQLKLNSTRLDLAWRYSTQLTPPHLTSPQLNSSHLTSAATYVDFAWFKPTTATEKVMSFWFTMCLAMCNMPHAAVPPPEWCWACADGFVKFVGQAASSPVHSIPISLSLSLCHAVFSWISANRWLLKITASVASCRVVDCTPRPHFSGLVWTLHSRRLIAAAKQAATSTVSNNTNNKIALNTTTATTGEKSA